ncbi:MAG: tyrosine-type recombinase/integrase [Treponema sp.]|jgi:site-specific recombinase XerD|nr:tyrosine-type recombinase/integrase [Treponema sp.]
MDVVYLFYHDNRISVPLSDFDPALFKRLIRFGRWDRQNRRILMMYRPDPGGYRDIFTRRPYVEVREGPGGPEVKNFLGRPWPDIPVQVDEKDMAILVSNIPNPEKLSFYWAEKLKTELHARKYSRKTIGVYVYYNRDLCRVLQKNPEEITEGDFKKYMAYLDTVRDQSSSSMNLALSAVRFFYTNVLKRDFARDLYRPRQDKRLPGVLSRAEIRQLLDTEQNPKHRLLLMLAYSSGLRVSELVALKREHVDFSRRTLLVYGAKGRRDRLTLLGERAAAFLKEYCELYGITGWIFPGQKGGHIQTRTAQSVFDKAAAKALINKQVSIHSLRHTFATHLLENGTDIKYIQTLLGHRNLRTTERYIHIARRNVLRIQSPLDADLPD